MIFLFVFLILFSAIYSQQENPVDPWKVDVQIFLGFKGDEMDGVMGEKTFDSLKEFARLHDIMDVVLRGEYEDLGFWGFQQYMLKYHQYWIRELKNRKIIEDVLNKEYLRQADETLYDFEISIQNAQMEVERLTQAKSRSKRLAQEKQELDKWEVEKKEAERIISSLKENIVVAEQEAEKWTLERIRARRLSEEQEQLQRLEDRKTEALLLTSELGGVINLAKNEVDRLVNENEKLQDLIKNSAETKSIALELKAELKSTRIQINSLIIQKDSLEQKLLDIQSRTAEKELLTNKEDAFPRKKKKWYRWLWPFGKKNPPQ